MGTYTASDPDGSYELMEEACESLRRALGCYVKSTINENQKHELTQQFHLQRFYRHLAFVVAADMSHKLTFTISQTYFSALVSSPSD